MLDTKPIPQPPAPQADESTPNGVSDAPQSVAGEEDPEAGLDEPAMRDALRGEAGHAAHAGTAPEDPSAPLAPPEIDPALPPHEVPPPPPPITVPGSPPAPPIQARARGATR